MDIATKTQRECEERVAEEYLSSLSDLNCNSKPLINMLTMLAEENIEYAAVIVKVVEQHIAKVPPEIKLPILYLIDSIVKNVKSTYVQLFSQCIVNLFCGVFEKVNEKIRERMYALRQTWNEVFSAQKLYALDVKIKRLDNNWPITAKQPSIHVNPNFLKTANQAIPTEMEKILQDKTRELLELKKRKLELELEATKKHLEEQEKQFSKTAEGVLPPVDALVVANALQTVGIRPAQMGGQVIPPVMAPGYMGPQGMALNHMRPSMYHHNIRGFRPNLHPAMMGDQSQAIAPVANMGPNINKPRVHPVNSALISSVRQRDPRLARQQQQQQLQQQQPQQQMQPQQLSNHQQHALSNPASASINQNQAAPVDTSKSSRNERNHKSNERNRKSPTRSTSTSNSSSSRSSSSRSGKSSSREKDRDRNKRSGSLSKSSSSVDRKKSASTSSYGSKLDKHSSSSSSSAAAKCDKDAFEIAPLSSAFKRKSTSPSSSPSKSRESKRSNKSRSSRSKTSSRSPSPESMGSYKNVNSRRMSTTSSSSASIMASPEKKISKLTDTTTEQDMKMSAGDIINSKDGLKSNVVDSTSAISSTDKKNLLSAPSTSFTGNNNNNKNASTTTPAVVGNDVKTKSEFDMKDIKRDMDGVGNAADSSARDEVSKDHDEDVKKRPLAPIKDEEPLAKKSKPTKLDNLFGSEDVDLRQLMPPLSVNTQDDTAPPPPPFNLSTESNENWDNVKTDVAKTPSTKKSSFEDVRAKLAKTAKLNKLLKLDKQNKDIDHRNKLAELQMNEDTQEANDEKIRTMIAQAQELLESKSINQEQYKNLVKNVMSINEDYKLKEAKRRESLNAFRDRSNNDDGSNDSSERNAAREAIFKKRIPKLSKTSSEAINSEILNEGSCGSGNMDEPMRLADDKHDSNDEPPMRSSRREKRGGGHKVSKWGDRVPDPPMMPSGPRPWNSLMQQNKRGGAPMPFRPNIPPNVRPPWQMGNNNNNNGPPHFPKAGPPMGPHMRGSNVIPPIGPQSPIPPPMIPRPCNSIDNPQEDIVRTITIDGAAKEIRFYDHVAIVFMEVDQPREIGFQNGQRTIFIDNHEPITLQFNHDYKPVTIDGETYNLRFGFPSRELFIDDHWYEIYFGGPAINVPIRNKIHMLKAEGPPPQVNIGNLRRDLVVGKINMIVDAHNVIPLFLDARVQTFKLGDMDHTIQFADNLLTVLLDGTPTRVEYGGLPKSLYLGTNKYFIRFGALPQGIIAGKVQIKDMIYVETKPPANADPIFNTPPAVPMLAPTEAELGQVDLQKPAETSVPILPAAALSSINIDELFQKLVSTGILGGSSGILPAVNSNTQASASSVESSAATKPTTADSAGEEVPQPTPASVTTEAIKPIDLSKPESIKTRQSAIVATLFSGMQCSSCGVRFPPEQTIKYSQHLDWHFRQNRRERDSSRKAHSRKWYYDLNDWIQYEEIEDVDEREKNFFDTPQTDIEIMDETSNQRSTNSPIQSCPAGPDDVDRACDMCQEKFEHFYNEELEEWHLRCAIRVEEKTYHPLCYEDYKASLNPPQPAKEEEEVEDTTEEPSLIQIDDDNAVDIVIKVEEDSKEKSDSAAKLDDEDDDVIVLPNEEPSVTEIYDDDDDDEYVPANVTREHMGTVHEEDEGGDLNETNESDVEIQEPHIPFTDLDTYVEKELPEGTSRDTFMNVKIKEEPNAEEDEDDGFEDVGTVLIAPDEISIHSSEETQTQLIESSTSAMSPIVERPASTTPSVINDEIETNTDMPITDLNNSMDGNIETGDEHNLSAAGPVPAMPLASLVNKIKINITKNTVTTNSTASSSNSSSTMSSNTCKSNSANSNTSSLTDHSKGSIGSSASGATTFNHIPTISTIPVLCGGGTTITSTQSSIGGGGLYDEPSNIPSLSGSGGGVSDNSVSSISVIGSIYGSNGPATVIRPIPQATNVIPPAKPATPPPPPPVEETITYELKPELQKATLKKKEKVICGNETSGLCSIM